MRLHTPALELASLEEKINKGENISKYFKIYVFITVFIEFILLLGNIGIVIGFQNSGFIWTKIIQLVIGIRFMLLFLVLVSNIDVYKIKGVDIYYSTMTHFSYYTSLGIWFLLGFIFLYILYWWILIVDIIFLLTRNHINFTQFSIYIIVDVLFIIEHWLSYLLVYKCGISKQFKFHFPKEKNKGNTKKRRTNKN
jgi:hypothetical protein